MNTKEEKRNPKVDGYLRRAKKWQEEIKELRRILLDCPLTEELKWGKPCYTFSATADRQEHNVVIIVPFKDTCALLFPKGALLKDAKGILVRPTENTQAARQLRFTSVREIVEMASVLKAYIREAIAVEKAGLEVSYKKTSDFKIPAELKNKFKESAALKAAFSALTPGRQRGYLLYFSAAKQSQTRESRIEKCRPHILKGKGLHDQ